MGGATGTSLVATDPAIQDEVDDRLRTTAAEVERRWRSPIVNVIVTLAAALVALGPRLPFSVHVFGEISGAEALWVAATAWGLFELATISFYALGPAHPASRLLATIDTFDRYAVVLVLIYLSGSASSPLWVIVMVNAFAFAAKPERLAKLELAFLVVSHVALALAFVVRRSSGDAWLTVLVMLASTAGQTMSARMVGRSARVRAERDVLERRLHEKALLQDRERMARELHDGLGADVMALVMDLRRAAERDPSPEPRRLADAARALLDELRSVVWSLRNEQGTLAELGKLIDATCRGVRGDALYERTTPLDAAQARIGPATALGALGVARELVRSVATRGGVTRLFLSLSIADALEITVVDDGPSLSAEALETLERGMDALRRTLDGVDHVGASNQATGEGVRLHAVIALDALRPVR